MKSERLIKIRNGNLLSKIKYAFPLHFVKRIKEHSVRHKNFLFLNQSIKKNSAISLTTHELRKVVSESRPEVINTFDIVNRKANKTQDKVGLLLNLAKSRELLEKYLMQTRIVSFIFLNSKTNWLVINP